MSNLLPVLLSHPRGDRSTVAGSDVYPSFERFVRYERLMGNSKVEHPTLSSEQPSTKFMYPGSTEGQVVIHDVRIYSRTLVGI